MPTFTTPDPITAAIDVVSADVRIRATDAGTTTVDVQPSDDANREDVRAAQQTRVHYANGTLVVKAPKLRSWLSRSDGGSIDVTIELPVGSRLAGSGQLADFHAEGALGDCRLRTALGRIEVGEAATVSLKTATGDVAVGHATRDAELAASSGEIRAQRLDGSAVIKNSNGDTWIGEAAGDVRIRAANGNAVIERAGGDVSVKTAHGDLRIDDVVRGSVELETHAGDIEIGIHEGTAAWLDASVAAGRLDNQLEAADDPGSGETVEVRARTSLGNVVVRRAQLIPS